MDTEPIKGLDTPYKGYRFRSRTEAKWAVFFDVLEMPWRYELRGVWQHANGGYLPDFLVHLSGVGHVWTEIKPYLYHHGDQGAKLTDHAARTLDIMADLCHLPIEKLDVAACPGMLLGGDPDAGVRAIIVWPRESGSVQFKGHIARCPNPNCRRFCFFAEMGCPVTRYAVCCQCLGLGSFVKVRMLPQAAQPYICDLAIVEAASIARSTRFDVQESPVPLRLLRSPIGSRGAANPRSKLTIDMVRDARKRYYAGEPMQSIAESLGVDESTISRAIRGKTWRKVS